MATGGFRPNATTDFLEEWKAKREKMRAKMLGDIAAATGASTASLGTTTAGGTKSEMRAASSSLELNNNGNPGSTAVNCGSPYAMARSSSTSALRRPEDDPPPPAPTPTPTPTPTPIARVENIPAANLKRTPPSAPEKAPCTPQQESTSPPAACNDSDKDSPSSSKGKEKKSSGPSARKGKGQIEKRKLREKRRSTGVVSIPSNESLDELDDDEGGEKKKGEEELTQHNTVHNESMTSDPAASPTQDSPRSSSGRHKSSEEEAGGNSRQRHHRHGREAPAAPPGEMERRMEELEKELARERQETARLLKSQQDKEDLIGKLKEEIDLLNRDLDDIEDENEQLKQENKTLLKVVGQLTR